MRDVLDVFLDANVLFSASYKAPNRLLRLVEEAIRNIVTELQAERLENLLRPMRVVAAELELTLFDEIVIAEKDRHVLESAIGAGAHYLLTGDKKHFGHYFDRNLCGTTILLPMEFLDRYPRL